MDDHEENELVQLRQENKVLNTKLMSQYALNNKLQKQLNRINKPDKHYKLDREQSELEPLSSVALGHERTCSVASTVNLVQKIKGGALILNLCKCYSVRIYLHYWLWQIPIIITNIILSYIWLSTDNMITQLGFLAVGPVFFAALIRDRLFVWLVYWTIKHLFCCNKYFKYHFSRLLDCIGGLHASFGVTAYLWNAIYFYDIFLYENCQFNGITITAFALPTLLLFICISAAPCFRYYYHNSFEILHRYLNWLSLCFLVVHVYYVNKRAYNESDFDGIKLFLYLTANTPSIFAIGLVILTLYPWLMIHKIKGKNVELVPANSGVSTAFIFPIWSPMGAVCKISTNWAEFHVMGITPLGFDKEKGHHRSLVLIKDLGDWSKSLTVCAKKDELKDHNFWIHRVKPPNFSQGLFMWKKVFALATGAGIAPLIPYVVNTKHFDVQISLVWVARDHKNNYPEFIVDILIPLPNVILYDTTTQKRPDLSLLTMEKAKEFEAEAVFIVSNPKTAYNVANYVNKKGIPVFASNFDV